MVSVRARAMVAAVEVFDGPAEGEAEGEAAEGDCQKGEEGCVIVLVFS